ncbi:MAG: DUF3078 domain-containing protein [Prevotella sp.]|nr:DUF3078 domain-containing protein [Prevotella sp.]
MRLNKFFLVLILFLFVFASLNAQNIGYARQRKDSILNNITNIDRQLKKISDRNNTTGFSAPVRIDTAFANKLNDANLQLQRNKKGLIVLQNNWAPFDERTSFRDTVIIDPVFLPVIFDGKILPSDINFLSKSKSNDIAPDFHLIPADSTFAPQLARTGQIDESRRVYYMNNPLKIKLNVFDFKDAPTPTENFVEKRNIFKELLTTDDPIGISMPEVEKIQIKPVYWIINGKHELQVSQNSFSEKWGSDNNFNLYSNHLVNANYKKKKISFNNLFEWRLNLQQMTGSRKEEDKEMSKINIIDDYFRTYSTFSIEAFKKWSYSTNLEMRTPLFIKKKVDEPDVVQRAILSPFELNLGVGMRYNTENISKVDKYRKFNVAADLSVLSLNYKYVGYQRVDRNQFGIKEGHKAITEYGSTFNVNLSYSRNRYTNFTSRIKYFTNYEKVYIECENSMNFALNRYLSTTVYLYIKYDDSLLPENRDPKFKFFNYNEMLRFGLTYTW